MRGRGSCSTLGLSDYLLYFRGKESASSQSTRAACLRQVFLTGRAAGRGRAQFCLFLLISAKITVTLLMGFRT